MSQTTGEYRCFSEGCGSLRAGSAIRSAGAQNGLPTQYADLSPRQHSILKALKAPGNQISQQNNGELSLCTRETVPALQICLVWSY